MTTLEDHAERCVKYTQGNFTRHEAVALVAKAIRDERDACADIAKHGCLVPPDGGSPTQEEVDLCDKIAARINGRK